MIYVRECFAYRSFIVSGLTFRSLIHFEFIFVYGVRKCSNFIFFACSYPGFLAPHTEEAVFPAFFILASFVKNKVPIGACFYLWTLYLVALVSISVFVPVPRCFDDCNFVVQSEARKLDSSSSILFSQYCFGYSGSFVFPYKL